MCPVESIQAVRKKEKQILDCLVSDRKEDISKRTAEMLRSLIK